MKKRRDFTIKRLNGIYTTNLQASGVDHFNEWATLVDNKGTVKVGDSRMVKARNIILCTGGTPSRLGIPGEEFTINSDDFFTLEEQPKKVAVIGAGYIAVELAGIFNALGSDTHLFTRFDGPLRPFDSMVRSKLMEFMTHDGVTLHPNSTPTGIQRDSKKKLTLAVKATVAEGAASSAGDFEGFDHILVAVGRVPMVEKLGLEQVPEIKVRELPRHIVVDEFQSTDATGIFALGDVCGKIELTPMAIAAGRRLADRLFGGRYDAKADYN
eukprot:Selendium_serpulae@DN6347_c0_g1_i3.p1